MNAALYDEAEGYYRRADRKRWGREGDYRTSPERSELFAATFARYFARLYDELQRPSEWTIVEVGPGGGHFATSMLRALQDSFSQVFGATRYVPIETNDELKALTPINAGVFFSNELLDAFPVHRLTRTGDELSELYVALNVDERFVWSAGPLSTPALAEFCREYSVELEEGQSIEVNLAIDEWLSLVAAKLETGFWPRPNHSGLLGHSPNRSEGCAQRTRCVDHHVVSLCRRCADRWNMARGAGRIACRATT